MSYAFAGFAIRLLGMLGGAGVGYAYAWHRIALNIAYMRTHWGWVCGTGLDMSLYFWTPVGAIAGLAFGVLLTAIWRRALWERTGAAADS